MRKVLLLSLLLGGCVRASDIDIRHPLVSRAVDPNRIVKPHDFAARNRGLPYGALNDEAIMMQLDERQACFDVTIRELRPVDLAASNVMLGAPGLEPTPAVQVMPDPPTQTPYNGLVPVQQVVGQQRFCSVWTPGPYSRCAVWVMRPIYATVMVPGRVDVFASHARTCFNNNGIVGPQTEQAELIVRGAKNVAFRWGLIGAQKK